MFAIKPSSTKSAKLWSVKLQPSKIFSAIYLGCLTLSVIALWQCPLAPLTRAAMIWITIAGGVLIYLPTLEPSTLTLQTNGAWVYTDTKGNFQGLTSAGSYRSMALIVIAIKPEKGRKQHVVVWRDSVSPSIFSALHIRLATTPANLL